MNLIDIFASPFKLVGFREFSRHGDGFKAIYKTSDIYDETTKEEIYILSKMYLDNIVSRYATYMVGDKPISETSFRLYVEQIEDDVLTTKHIYSFYYNNMQNRLSWENKYDDNFTIEGDFHLAIEVIGHVIENYDSEDDEDDPEPPKKAISEPECIICYEKQPDILYTECLHRVVCFLRW